MLQISPIARILNGFSKIQRGDTPLIEIKLGKQSSCEIMVGSACDRRTEKIYS